MDAEAEAARRAWQQAERKLVLVPVGSPAWREAVWEATLERELYRHLTRDRGRYDARVRPAR